MTIDRQEVEKKAQALLKFELGNHNAKRYGEAAGFYEVILQRYPDTEAAQYTWKNLESLVSKVEGLELIQPPLSGLDDLEPNRFVYRGRAIDVHSITDNHQWRGLQCNNRLGLAECLIAKKRATQRT